MPRIARIVAPGLPHHITQRGNRGKDVFLNHGQRQRYMDLLARYAPEHGLAVQAYCLMSNHVHLIAVPETADGLCRGIGEAHRRYTRRINFREGWRGHLWQGRFASFVMDQGYLLAATRYVERNPVKAGLVAKAEDWAWSSAASHVAGRGDAVADGQWLAERIAGWVCTWREYLLEPDEADLAVAMRQRENTGRPLGDESFVKRVGALLRRDLLPKKRGRKGTIKRTIKRKAKRKAHN